VHFVSVVLRCRCGDQQRWCVRVDRSVPEPLRCVPGGGGGGGVSSAIICRRCGDRCFDSPHALERATQEAVRGGWGQWVPQGAVILNC
jgi:hypothetical protein